MNISQLTDILLDIKINIDNNNHTDLMTHISRLKPLGLDIIIKDKQVINTYRPGIKTPESEKTI